MKFFLLAALPAILLGSSANSGGGVSPAFTSDLFSESRALLGGTPQNASQKGLTLSGGQTTTLLNYSGQPGYLSVMWFGITGSQNSMTLSTLTMTIDGEATPSINARIPLYFGAEYLWNTNNFGSRFIGGETNSGSNVGYYSLIPVPFSISISIQLTNGDSNSSMTIWYEATYQVGVADTWPYAKKLHLQTGTVTGLIVDQIATLVNVSGLNSGRLFGVYMSIDSSPGGANPATAPLEGKVRIFFDGASSASYTSSGTEDYFHFSNYFENTPSGFTTDYTGCPFISGSNVTWNCYRFHVLDPMLFQNALKITWECGESSVHNFSGTVRLSYTVWYYTN